MDVDRYLPVLLIISFLVLSPCSSVFSQKSLLERKINLSFNQAPLERVFIHMSNEAEFNFSYNANLVDLDTLVSVVVRDATVDEVLSTLLSEDISYKVTGNHLILLKERSGEERAG
jgi:hypothetical protein